jgi:MoaA/NifB/PqqE/SkfB family radical SAM enzyme
MHDKFELFELEITTRCNASCPQWSRNYYGGRVWPTVPMTELTLSWLQEKFSQEFLSSFKQIRLVGTYGDPCIHQDLIPIVRWLKKTTQANLLISTNGSLRTVKWWKELAQALTEQDRVMFGIDGLEDTNHLHRRGTNFKKIINNLSAFNLAGGKSIWQFIVFQHNEHQINQAEQLSKQLKCHGFAVKTTNRFVNKKHELIDEFPVMNKKDKIVYWLKLPKSLEYQNPGYNSYKESVVEFKSYQDYLRQTKINCYSLANKLLSVSAEGIVLPCAWLLDRIYGYEAESHPDHKKLFDLIKQAGGIETINLNHESIESIVNGNFFRLLEESWTNGNRLDRCANQCGTNNKFETYDNIEKHI